MKVVQEIKSLLDWVGVDLSAPWNRASRCRGGEGGRMLWSWRLRIAFSNSDGVHGTVGRTDQEALSFQVGSVVASAVGAAQTDSPRALPESARWSLLGCPCLPIK